MGKTVRQSYASINVLVLITLFILTSCSGVPKTKTVEMFASGVETTAKAIDELTMLEIQYLQRDRLMQDIDSNRLNELKFDRQACENDSEHCVIKYELRTGFEVTLGGTENFQDGHKKIIKEIKNYAKLLKAIATTNQAKEFDEQIKALRKSTDNIYTSLSDLGKEKANPNDKKNYESYMNLTQKVVTFIGKQYIDYKRKAILHEAVDKGNSVIPPAVDLLKEIVQASMKIVATDITYRFELDYLENYNKGLDPKTLKKIQSNNMRNSALSEISKELNAVKQQISLNPAKSLDKIKTNLNGLSKEMDKENVDLSGLFSQVSDFYEEANAIYEAIIKLNKLKN